jgi:hypothetical protein
MPYLTRSLQAFGTPDFEAVLKRELAAQHPDVLGLQQGLRAGSVGLSDDLGVMILRIDQTPALIQVRVGIFYTSMLSGCACADDPTPENASPEYCELELEIHRQTSALHVVPGP